MYRNLVTVKIHKQNSVKATTSNAFDDCYQPIYQIEIRSDM